jgi:hypothetical protein
MPIINSRFPIIDTSKSSIINFGFDNFLWKLRNWDDHDYWFIEVKIIDDFQKISLDIVVPDDILKKIKNDSNFFLVVSNTHEAFHSIVEPLYLLLVFKYNLPPKKIILMSESADIHLVVKEVASRYKSDTFQVEWTLIFQESVREQLVKNYLTFKNSYNGDYKKKFLNLNRRWRLHRPALVSFLKSLNLLDYGYVSLGRSENQRSWGNIFPWLLSHYKKDDFFFNLLNSNKDEILSLPDLYIDTDDLLTNRVELTNSLDYFYQTSMFSIVSETNFYTEPGWEPGRFFSEKIFKPMAHKHPFILVSVPNSLHLLREIGYKTYSSWIDESYDNEIDDNLRMKKILNEIKRLCHLTESEVKDFVLGTRSIAEHNFKKLLLSKLNIYKKI